MKNTTNESRSTKSLYAMVARADHEERSAYEAAVYMLLILCGVFSMWQVAHQPLRLPTGTGVQSVAATHSGSSQQGV